jgi:hypothetical protein
MNSFYQLLKITLEGLLVPFGFETFLLSVVHSLIFFSIYYFAIIMIWRVSKEVFYPYLSILLTLLTVAFLMVVFSLYYLLFYSGKITTGFTSCEVKNILQAHNKGSALKDLYRGIKRLWIR